MNTLNNSKKNIAESKNIIKDKRIEPSNARKDTSIIRKGNVAELD